MQKILLLPLLVVLSCNDATQTTTPTHGPITESVYASGTIKSDNQYTVFSTVAGIIQKIDIEAGQDINEGQVLFELENDKGRLATENARLTYQLTRQNSQYIESKINESELAVQLATEKLATDRSFYERNKKAQQYGGITDADFEKVTLTYHSAVINLATAKKQLSQLRAQLQNEQTKNKVTLLINQKNQGDYSIKSALSGQVYDVLVKKGALITLQTPLAVIGEKNTFVIELEVDENDMVGVVLQQQVLITMDSYKGQVFEARVDKVYPIMDSQSRTFKIEAHFIKPPGKLYPNLSTEANIIIRTKTNALTIPRDYLLGSSYVLVNKTEKRKVETGLSDYQHVEITAGLQANELIYKPE